MQSNLLKYSVAVAAFPRILSYKSILSKTDMYFDRLRIVNESLGPHWIFRLADAVSLEVIKINRASWYRFYVEDIDQLHCPLDPGAPETSIYLGRDFADMDMAFYAGMGFDGYRLALETSRIVDFEEKTLELDSKFKFSPSCDLKTKLDLYDENRHIPKEDYYASYGDALQQLYRVIDNIHTNPAISDEIIESAAVACLILLCGGHHGCSKHITKEEEFRAQMESLIIFSCVRGILIGEMSVSESCNPPLKIVTKKVS